MVESLRLEKIHAVHCVGIGGIGVSAIAKYFLAKGARVSGSDLAASEITKELAARGVNIFIGPHDAAHLPEPADLVVFSPAAPKDNPELEAANARGIPIYSYPVVLGMLMEGTFGIAVSGTHGKSTTTSLLGLLLIEGGMDPTVIVGSRAQLFDGNIRMGKSRYFVAEACEWRAHMMHLHPHGAILTNIDADHLDYYQNVDQIISAFGNFFSRIPKDGFAVLPAGAPYTKTIAGRIQSSVFTFGFGDDADFRAHSLKVRDEQQKFEVDYRKEKFGSFSLSVPGSFNVENALAACAAAHHLGIPVAAMQKALEEFPGIWRRFERVGEHNGALVISDYAHHPTAVAKTIRAAREFFPGRRIIAVFQPHHRHRTRVLFQNFVRAFNEADVVILSEIYDVAGREEEQDQNVTSATLADAIERHSKDVNVTFSPDLAATRRLIGERTKPNDIILIMGAGDVDKVARDLIEKS